MSKENEKPGVDSFEAEVARLQEQVQNLNAGIASVREENKSIKNENTTLKNSLEDFKSKFTDKGKDENLSPAEQKKFEKWAAAQGFATKQDLEEEKTAQMTEAAKQVQTTAVSEFLEKHPEYDNDDEWAKVQAEFALYKTPKDLTSYRKLLNRIHETLTGTDKNKARDKARAEIKGREALSRGGNSSASGAAADETTEAEIEKMSKKYPSLTREQILARLSEVRSLYPTDDKK